ncbi:AAA family ATPase [Krasilnikovia sp. MM14-A1004]|uniref:helix-turn-helix transcriptional regulator n=1 Tax=Krasilnikovia sp. MM14-A1004 TaxID=3373541 RepID=UPI00399CD398
MAMPSASTTSSLVGRDGPCLQIAELLESLIAGRGGALVICGEPGIGKTVLLEHARRMSGDCTLLSAVGLESESELPFVALGDVVRPLQPFIGDLPQPQADALRAAVALETTGRPSGLYAVCMGALTLLATAAERRPLLLLVDDAHWLDTASASVLSFVARRVANDPVGVIFAVRDMPSPLDTHGLSRITISGLTLNEGSQLISQLRKTPIAPQVASRLWHATRGNPLALREVALRLDDEQLGGARPLPDPLPLGADLTRIFVDQLEPLPEHTRTALLVLALAAWPDATPTLLAALSALGISPAALDPADHARLIVADHEQLRFSHPLVRSAVASAASGWQRQQAYRALAASAQGDAQLWYRAAAAAGPDDALAEALVDSARGMRERSGFAAAARTMHRAAQLDSDPERRAGRLLAAAADALFGGLPDEAGDWLDQGRALTTDDRTVADIDLMRGRAFTTRGIPAIAERVLTSAADAIAPTDPGRAARLLCEAALPILTDGRVSDAERSCRRAVQLAEVAADPASLGHARLVLAQSLVLRGDIAGAKEALGAAPDAVDPVEDALVCAMLGACRCWLEEFDDARQLLDKVVDAARRHGQLGTLGHALNYRSEVARCTGEWAQAYADAEESLRLGREVHMTVTVGLSLLLLARLDAAQGRKDLVARRLDEATEMSGPLGTGGLLVWAGGVQGLAFLADDAPESTLTCLEEVREFALRNGVENPNMVLWQPDLVEAYWRCGRPAEAEARLKEFEEQAQRTGLVTPIATVERCRGMLAADLQAAEQHFAAALALHRRKPNPFEEARTALYHAEALRRYRRPADARPLLRAALATFRQLGAAPFARRAAAELAAAGERPSTVSASGDVIHQLSPQELRVAMEVARGLSNPEVATALFISRKTVEAHLSSVYRKLELSSRTQLVRCLTAAGVSQS